MKRHEYTGCIYTGLFVFPGEEFGEMTEVISQGSNFNQVPTSEREKIYLFVILLLEDYGKTKKVTM